MTKAQGHPDFHPGDWWIPSTRYSKEVPANCLRYRRAALPAPKDCLQYSSSPAPTVHKHYGNVVAGFKPAKEDLSIGSVR
jgi:hypothetical protein